MTTETKISSIVVIGRRWFDRVNGNTYYSAEILIDGKTIDGIDYAYGYGDQYLQDASDAIERAGHLPDREHHANGSVEPLWQYCRDRDIALHSSVSDVSRKRDL